MSEITFSRDGGVEAFSDASGAANSDGDEPSFSWDEQHIVHVDAPADLTGAFDTERFYKIEDATIARPIKQPYIENDAVQVYKKPAEELQRAAWSFDNAPFTLGHPDTGMVRSVDDIHGFWRNPRYDSDEHRLDADLYIPATDDEALGWVEDHNNVSVGFYNRTVSEYEGETGDLTDDEVDGFQVDIYGNHVAGVEQGRCSDEHGCGLDGHSHGTITDVDDAPEQVASTDAACGCNVTLDAPEGVHTEDGKWYGVAPSETADDEPKYELDNCNDVKDAWNLRGSGDYDIDQSTLEARIKRAADAHDCPPEQRPWEDETNDSNMSDEDTDFDIPDLSIDALAAKNDEVADLKETRDELQATIDEMEADIKEALDTPEHIEVNLEEDDCVCDGVEALAEAADEAAEQAEQVEDLQDELEEYRAEEKEEALDNLEDLGADRDEWSDESLDAIEEEVERREEVLDEATSVKDIDTSTDSGTETDEADTSYEGTRTFGRGHSA